MLGNQLEGSYHIGCLGWAVVKMRSEIVKGPVCPLQERELSREFPKEALEQGVETPVSHTRADEKNNKHPVGKARFFL
jgi:hypothetical protein